MEPEYKGNGIKTGTTIIALEYDGGVIIAADSRTSCQNYVANRIADKLTPITDHIYCCRSGAAAQTQSLAKDVIDHIRLFEIVMDEPALVHDVAMQFRNRIYKNRSQACTSVIVAGWDKVNGGQVFSVPVTGLLIHEPYAVAGSGSAYIIGFVASKYHPKMHVDDAVKLALEAVRLAIMHDCCSGGVVRIGIINECGIETRVIGPNNPEVCQIVNKMLWNLEIDDW